MSTRERKHEDVRSSPVAQQPIPRERRRVETLQRNARTLLDTARGLIDDTLSGQSEEYLNAVRQQGGQ
jgi:hypothetical protein